MKSRPGSSEILREACLAVLQLAKSLLHAVLVFGEAEESETPPTSIRDTTCESSGGRNGDRGGGDRGESRLTLSHCQVMLNKVFHTQKVGATGSAQIVSEVPLMEIMEQVFRREGNIDGQIPLDQIRARVKELVMRHPLLQQATAQGSQHVCHTVC